MTPMERDIEAFAEQRRVRGYAEKSVRLLRKGAPLRSGWPSVA